MYSFKVLLGGEEIEFVGETKSEALCKLDAYMEELLERGTRRNRNSYVKRRIWHNLDYYRTEIKAYSKLLGLDICPKLVDHGVLFEYKILSEKGFGKFYRTKISDFANQQTFYAYYIEVEMHGCSLAVDYNVEDVPCLDSRNVEEGFNFSPYPKFVKEQIKDLVERMHKAGVYHQDFYAGNLVIQDGKVKIIDFELCEFAP